MIIQNCLGLLKDIAHIEVKISKLENKLLEEQLEVDYDELLTKLVRDITDK